MGFSGRSLFVFVGALVGALVGLLAAFPSIATAEDDSSSEVSEAKTEFGIVPLIGGDTDYGIGVGQLSSLARMDPTVKPYLWQLESAFFVTFKLRTDNGATTLLSPYQDAALELTISHFLHERLRLFVRPSFTRETTQRYYGLGNASPAPDEDVPARDEYGRMHPTLHVRLRLTLAGDWFWEFGTAYTENWFDINPEGTLGTQMREGTPTERALLGTAEQHGVLLVENSLIYDSRESEVSTDSGQFHQLKLRLSPRMGPHFPYQYGQLNLTNRFYFRFAGPRLRLDLRTVLDLQFGDVPFYELARYENTFALGGGSGVRGVPGQRYYGRVKAFANLELRSRFFDFHIGQKPYIVGGVVFFDFGRLWAELRDNPDLDGSGLGLKYGAGGGLRLQQGETFVVRLDVAWSPDARPVGVYVAAGQLF